MADMRAIGTALGSYQVDTNHFPRDLAVIMPGYYQGATKDGWGTPFIYNSDGKGYTLRSYGRDRKPGSEEGEFDSDIIFANGEFVAPASLAD